MTIQFECPFCRKQHHASDDQAGSRAICSGCGESVDVPDAPIEHELPVSNAEAQSEETSARSTESDSIDDEFGAEFEQSTDESQAAHDHRSRQNSSAGSRVLESMASRSPTGEAFVRRQSPVVRLPPIGSASTPIPVAGTERTCPMCGESIAPHEAQCSSCGEPVGAIVQLSLPGGPSPFRRPNRAGFIFAFSILSWVLCPVFGVIAWVMANADLNEMKAGLMDQSGESLTQAGRILSIVSLVVSTVALIFYCVGMMYLMS